MAFSLSNWFKGKPGAPGSEQLEDAPSHEGEAPGAPVSPVVPAHPPAPQPAAVRTVVPNSVQPVSLRTPGSVAPRVAAAPLPVSAPPPAAAPGGRVSPVIPASRGKISFGGAPAPEEHAGAPVPAPEAIADVTVSLEVGDFLDRLPPNFVQSRDVDRHRRINFRASELYSDLTKGRASVPASVIYQKCPELFSRPVTDEEDTEVSLPLQKLVEQMSQAFQTRSDQVAEENVGEIETPFLQVAIEDSARLPKAAGTTAGALRPVQSLAPAQPLFPETARRSHRTGQISTISPLKTAPEPAPMQAAPTAQTTAPINAAKRPPSTVRASVAGGKIRLSGPSMPTRMVPVNVPPPAPAAEAVPMELPPSASQRILPPLQVPNAQSAASPSHQVSKKTARIQIPPISLRGAGAPTRPAAPAAVPVQTSPIPVRPGPSAEPAAPAITFRSSPPRPPGGARPMPHSFAPPAQRTPIPPPAFPVPAAPVFTAEPAPAPVAVDARKISLSLAAILRGLPHSALSIEASSVPDNVRLTLPFSVVEPQLALGRIAVATPVFAAALPESHREVLAADAGLTEVPIPLQEVFQNLPAAALAIRQDQVVEEIGNAYPTPFSQKADEDAQRFGAPAVEAAPAASHSAPEAVAEALKTADEPLPEALAVDLPLPPESNKQEDATPVTAAPAARAEEARGADIGAERTADFADEDASKRDVPLDLSGEQKSAESATSADAGSPADHDRSALEAIEAAQDAKKQADEETPADEKAAILAPEAATSEESPTARTSGEAAAEPKHAEPPARDEESASAGHSNAELPEVKAGDTSDRALPDALEGIAGKSAAELPERFPGATSSTNGHTAAPSATDRQSVSAASGEADDTPLQSLFMTEDELDAKTIVRLVSAWPGLEGCAVMFEDGLQLAGNFPHEGDAEGFSAMAPPFFKRARNFTGEINFGALQAFTLHTERGLVSFFMHDQICVSVRHTGRGFLPGVREKLIIVTRELARMYATAAQTH
jgi:predicted regulator of Ras-like GTPase activity (Roadblock/LC7/MglB family)